MKHTALFTNFLTDVVNLNVTRIDQLDTSVDAIKTFLRGADWSPTVRGFVEQGSWAHKTIIRPIDKAPFDADLLIRVSPVEGWEARDYINTLKGVFRASSTYKDKVSSYSHCVTITYADDKKIDIAPLVIGRADDTSKEVCNRTSNQFEDSAPEAYTKWFNERNGYSGGNSFRKVTRLLKYLRGHKKTFKCPSVLLTTLLGNHISWLDKNLAGFADIPSSLQTLMGRLDDFLQANETKPQVPNPSMTSEDFAHMLDDDEYANFRTFVHKYRGWVDAAIAEEDFTKSIEAWQRIFGDQFGKDAVTKLAATKEEAAISVGSLLSSIAKHSDRLVEAVRDFGSGILPPSFNRPLHMQAPSWPRAAGNPTDVYVSASYQARRKGSDGRRIMSGDTLPPYGGLWFEARLWAGAPIDASHRVEWRITNTGVAAFAQNSQRGGFYSPESGSRRWESLEYRGVHIAEAFLIRRADNVLVGQSEPFHVAIL